MEMVQSVEGGDNRARGGGRRWRVVVMGTEGWERRGIWQGVRLAPHTLSVRVNRCGSVEAFWGLGGGDGESGGTGGEVVEDAESFLDAVVSEVCLNLSGHSVPVGVRVSGA
eukprot:364987-Chlamydomonas_euryale.AAC.9